MSGENPTTTIAAINRFFSSLMTRLAGKLDSDAPAVSAGKLTSPFDVTIQGDAAASGNTDGSSTLTLALTLANSGVGAGQYGANNKIPVVTLDAKGRVISAQEVTARSAIQEYATPANFPATGEADLLYIATVNGYKNFFVWNGTGYTNITSTLAVAQLADEATKLAASVSLSITGDASWTISVDGSSNQSAALTLANTGVTPGTYAKMTVDAKGRVTAGTSLAASDIPSLDASKIGSGSIPVSRGGTGGTDQASARSGLGIGSMATRNVTISTAAPSGGADGDVWFQY